MRIYILTIILLAPAFTHAGPWVFGEKQALTTYVGDKIFHHLDGTGRNHVSVAGDALAIVWEDNHSGSPQIYLSQKLLGAKAFSTPKLLSTGKSGFAPVITPYAKNEFLVAWEQDHAIWMCHVSIMAISQPMQVSMGKSSQAAIVVTSPQQAILAWSEKSGHFWQVMTAQVKLKNGLAQTVQAVRPIDPDPAKDNQLYPTLAHTSGVTTAMWEDRRNGHTMILYAQAEEGDSFGGHQVLNEIVQKSSDYGRGNGVTRAAMAKYGESELASTWMDKRGYSTGYDIFAAQYHSNEKKFGINQQVQDSFGNNIAQWNPAIAANSQGDIAVAWDDNRDETSDIWFSWKTTKGWSDNESVAPAAGAGQQTGPAMTFDDKRNLHFIWLEQNTENGPTTLYYSVGLYQP